MQSIVSSERAAVRMFSDQLTTVRWETRVAKGRGLEWRVFGPGALRRSYAFPDAGSLVEQQVHFEQQLVSDGYGLMLVSERRTGYDRRRHERLIEDRRK